MDQDIANGIETACGYCDETRAAAELALYANAKLRERISALETGEGSRIVQAPCYRVRAEEGARGRFIIERGVVGHVVDLVLRFGSTVRPAFYFSEDEALVEVETQRRADRAAATRLGVELAGVTP